MFTRKGNTTSNMNCPLFVAFLEWQTKSELDYTTNTLLCLDLIWTENNLSWDDSTTRTHFGESVSNFWLIYFAHVFPPNCKTPNRTSFRLPYIGIGVTTGALPSTFWCPLRWVLLTNKNCTLLRASKPSTMHMYVCVYLCLSASAM